jgi:hypothetical protein
MKFFDKLFARRKETPAAEVDPVAPVAADAEAAESSKAVPELEQKASPTEQSIAPTPLIRPFDLSRHTLTPSEPFLKLGPIDPFKDLSEPSLISFELDDSARRDRQFRCIHRYERVKSPTTEYDVCTACGHIVHHWSARI